MVDIPTGQGGLNALVHVAVEINSVLVIAQTQLRQMVVQTAKGKSFQHKSVKILYHALVGLLIAN